MNVLPKFFVIAMVALITPVSADPNASLSNALTGCWDSVDGGGLSALAEYGMEYERTEKPRPTIENKIWRGLVSTELGEIEIRAIVRDDVLFECKLQTFPEPPDANMIEYGEATETLRAWYGENLTREGYHETLSDIRFFGHVRCASGNPVISASAMSFGLVDPAILTSDQDAPIPGSLLVTIFRTSPKNYEFCAGSGAL